MTLNRALIPALVAAMKSDQVVGKSVTYTSKSGRKYQALITAVLIGFEHDYGNKPTVSLVFRDVRGKLVFKDRVNPIDPSKTFQIQTWDDLK